MSVSQNVEAELLGWERSHLAHEGTSSRRRMEFTAMVIRVLTEVPAAVLAERTACAAWHTEQMQLSGASTELQRRQAWVHKHSAATILARPALMAEVN